MGSPGRWRKFHGLGAGLFCVRSCSQIRLWSVAALHRVAVATALSGGPQHRSGRAELPHPALTLGVWHQSLKVDLVLFPCHAVDSRWYYTTSLNGVGTPEGLISQLDG